MDSFSHEDATWVHNPFLVLDCALSSRYVTPETLPALPIWDRLPTELQVALSDTALKEKPLREVVRLIGRVMVELHGRLESDIIGELTREMSTLRLGLLYMAHREGRLDTTQLLSLAWFVADSYLCDADPRPFSRLRAALAKGEPDGGRLEALFSPYTDRAEQCVVHWGLGQFNRDI